jgi:hypothetical protein
LIDYYPRVEFIVWRRDLCPGLDVGLTELEKAIEGNTSHDEYLLTLSQESPDVIEERGGFPPEGWPNSDTLYMARRLHRPQNKTQLIDNEAYLHGWSEKVFSSTDTRKMRKATKRRKFKQNCVSI